jgi:uncharacterized protein YraI
MTLSKLAAATACCLALGAAGAAAKTAVVTTDLNLRLGPGPAFEVVSVIPRNEGVAIQGCTPSMLWCQVSWGNQTGWAYGAYLAYELEGENVIVGQPGLRTPFPVVAPEVAVQGPATVGTIVAPDDVSVAVEADPPAPVRNFVLEHEFEPYVLEGEVVLGATLPGTVQLSPVPDYEYRVAYVNQRRVLVDPATREVVYLVR